MTEVQQNTYEVALHQFNGFYESVHNILIDNAVDQIFEDDEGEVDIPDEFWSKWSFTKDMKFEYCKLYVDQLKDHLKDEHEIGLPSMRVVEVTSPREYNFETDRIFVAIDQDDLNKLRSLYEVPENKAAVYKQIREMFTSRSGFSSHYSNNGLEWDETEIEEWDPNQLGTLLLGVTGGWEDSKLMEEKHEEVSRLIDKHMPDECEKIIRACRRRLEVSEESDGPTP